MQVVFTVSKVYILKICQFFEIILRMQQMIQKAAKEICTYIIQGAQWTPFPCVVNSRNHLQVYNILCRLNHIHLCDIHNVWYMCKCILFHISNLKAYHYNIMNCHTGHPFNITFYFVQEKIYINIRDKARIGTVVIPDR